MSHRTFPAGVTLVEVAVSTVLVGVVLVAALETLAGSMRTQRSTTDAVAATTLLEAMVAETMAVPVDDPDGNSIGIGREADETASVGLRLGFDDLGDFHGFTATPPVYPDGTAVPGLDGWTQSFRIRYSGKEPDGNGDLATISSDGGLFRVRCFLTDPDGGDWSLYGLRSRYGPAETPSPWDATRVGGVTVQIEAGGAGPLRKAAGVANLPESP